jgi:hypothetical protein
VLIPRRPPTGSGSGSGSGPGFGPGPWFGGGAALFYCAVAILTVVTVITIATDPAFLLLQIVVVVAALFGPRLNQRRKFINEIFQRSRKITRDEEYEADIAQDRRRIPALLRGDWRMLLFRTHWENVRKSVRPSKYIRVEFDIGWQHILTHPLRVWLPQREDVVRVVRAFPPIFQPHQGPPGNEQFELFHRAVAAFFGVGGGLGRVTHDHECPKCTHKFRVVDGEAWRKMPLEELQRQVPIAISYDQCAAVFTRTRFQEFFDEPDGEIDDGRSTARLRSL